MKCENYCLNELCVGNLRFRLCAQTVCRTILLVTWSVWFEIFCDCSLYEHAAHVNIINLKNTVIYLAVL
jgi:hypothetical protein